MDGSDGGEAEATAMTYRSTMIHGVSHIGELIGDDPESAEAKKRV
jgi:hypothetical protein